MNRTLLVGGMAVIFALVGSRAEADGISITPSTAGGCSTTINNNLADQALIDVLEGLNSTCSFDVTDSFSLLYKSNAGGGEGGSFASSYDTTFAPIVDPENATILQGGGTSMDCIACYLVVKDGKNSPAQYFFDISGWNGLDTLMLTGFWAGVNGGISNVAIWGSATTVGTPEPATLLLLGTGVGLAALRRRRRLA
jgi:PEP-CTERM motif-containing protein